MIFPNFVLGIDPGLTTGLALYDVTEDVMLTEEEHDGLSGLMEEWIAMYYPTVAVERFTITAKTHKNTAAPWSLELIGVARHLSRKYDCPFVLQGQSAAKNFCTDERLKALGWYERGKPHGVDAQRQVLLRLVDLGWWDERLSTP